jgi:hypothetical protein
MSSIISNTSINQIPPVVNRKNLGLFNKTLVENYGIPQTPPSILKNSDPTPNTQHLTPDT